MNSSRRQGRHTAAVWTHEKEEKGKRDRDRQREDEAERITVADYILNFGKKKKKKKIEIPSSSEMVMSRFFSSVKAIQRQQAAKTNSFTQ